MKPETHNGVVYLPISKTAVKTCIGNYNVYDRKWLLDHLETEYVNLANQKKLREKMKESICKDWED